MEQLTGLINAIDWLFLLGKMARVIMVLSLGFLAVWGVNHLLDRLRHRLLEKGRPVDELPSETAKRTDTLMRLLRQTARITVWITIALITLKEIGLDIAPLLASAGIVGLAVGFGAQNLVRDLIAGFFFILEDQVRVGDVAIVNGTGGLVEQMNLRTLVLKDLGGATHIFPNGAISTLSNLTHEWSAYVFDLAIAYKEDTDQVVGILRKVLQGLREDKEFGPLIMEEPEIFGVDKLADSAVIIKGRIKTIPIKQWEVGREFLRRVKYAFAQNGIEIPYPHLTIYRGETSKPLEFETVKA